MMIWVNEVYNHVNERNAYSVIYVHRQNVCAFLTKRK